MSQEINIADAVQAKMSLGPDTGAQGDNIKTLLLALCSPEIPNFKSIETVT